MAIVSNNTFLFIVNLLNDLHIIFHVANIMNRNSKSLTIITEPFTNITDIAEIYAILFSECESQAYVEVEVQRFILVYDLYVCAVLEIVAYPRFGEQAERAYEVPFQSHCSID